jgi:hypothetical protein
MSDKRPTQTSKASRGSAKAKASTPVARPPKTQFPPDPDRAAEAGFTYGEAGPEKPGRQMRTPPLNPIKPGPTSAELAQHDEDRKERARELRRRRLENDLEDVAEKIGPRGNYRR